MISIAMSALSLFRKIPLWAFAIAAALSWGAIERAGGDRARGIVKDERASHEITRGSVRILATAVVMQNAAVEALGTESKQRAKTGKGALQTRAKDKAASLARIERIVAPAPLSGRCVTPASVMESGL